MPSWSMFRPERTAVLSPVQGRVRVGEGTAAAHDFDLAQLAEIAGGEQVPHDRVAGQAERTGDDLRDQLRMLAGRRRPCRWASAAFIAIRASVRTCLPASSAASVIGQCRYGQVPIDDGVDAAGRRSIPARLQQLEGCRIRGRRPPTIPAGGCTRPRFRRRRWHEGRECAGRGCYRRHPLFRPAARKTSRSQRYCNENAAADSPSRRLLEGLLINSTSA